jgi:hemoglobin
MNIEMTQETQQQEEKSNLYTLIGGADKLREMVDRFYDLMELEPEFAGIRVMHPQPIDSSRDKLFWFLSGWMRARHLAYPIGISERDQWLRCMAWAMQEVGIAQELQEHLMNSFFQTADWMRNKPE